MIYKKAQLVLQSAGLAPNWCSHDSFTSESCYRLLDNPLSRCAKVHALGIFQKQAVSTAVTAQQCSSTHWKHYGSATSPKWRKSQRAGKNQLMETSLRKHVVPRLWMLRVSAKSLLLLRVEVLHTSPAVQKEQYGFRSKCQLARIYFNSSKH